MKNFPKSCQLSTTCQTSFFKCENHFLEEVEHSNEDVWVIQIQKSEDIFSCFLDISQWEDVKSIIKPPGIKTGMVNCHSNSLYEVQNWYSLILKTPSNLTTYARSREPNAVMEWVKDTLNKEVIVVNTDEEHKYLWGGNDVHMMIFLPPETKPPMFYLTLSVSLSHSISFGIAYTNHAYPLLEKAFGNSITSLSTAKYFVSTSNFNFEYGKESGEHLYLIINFNRIKLMLNTLQSQMAIVTYIISLAVFCLWILPKMYLKYCEEELEEAIISLLFNVLRSIAIRSRIPEPNIESLLNKMLAHMNGTHRLHSFHIFRDPPPFNSELPEWSFRVDSLQAPEGIHFCSECSICLEDYIEGVKINVLQ
ncbi:hypothetical protein CHUAL_011317 [Chamberlinius hualienensis]